jgi:putative transposase
LTHTYSSTLYHIVFGTKDRSPIIVPALRPRLYPYLASIIRNMRGTPFAINGVNDHVHILARLLPDKAVSDVLRELKACSSKWARQFVPKFGWQAGYGAFTVSPSQLDRVRRYVENQEAHHRRMSFEVEFRALLHAHRIDFSDEFFWK